MGVGRVQASNPGGGVVFFTMAQDSKPQQLALLESDDELILAQAHRRAGNFDLSRLKHTEERIKEMLQARAEGLGVRACARIYKMSEHTVLAIEEKYSSDVATLKKDLARDCRTAGRMAVSRMIAEMADMPKTSLPIIAGVMIDKMQVLEGEPSAIIGNHVGIAQEREDLNSMIAALPAAAQEVIDLPEPISAEDVPDKKGGDEGGDEGGQGATEEVGN